MTFIFFVPLNLLNLFKHVFPLTTPRKIDGYTKFEDIVNFKRVKLINLFENKGSRNPIE